MSETLLGEIDTNLSQLGCATDSDLVATEVKLSALLRHHELLLKLHADLPSRSEGLAKELARMQRETMECEKHSSERLTKLNSMETKQEELESMFLELRKSIGDRKNFESLSIFQKEKILPLISDLMLLLKQSIQAGASDDAKLIAARLEHNQRQLRRLEETIDRKFEIS